MTCRTLVIATCALLFMTSVTAPSRAAEDTITGTWTGTMGPDDTQQQPLKVDMRYDGKTITGVVTGPPYPGDIRTGTFDSATGALAFEVVVRNERKTVVIFEGTVAKGAASGSVTFDDGQKGVFRMTKDAVGQSTPRVASMAFAQSKPGGVLSGTRTGDMGPNDKDRHPIAVTMTFDGKAVSGLITHPENPGDIKRGTFDPATGALRLDMIVRDDELTRVVFEGKVVEGIASGAQAQPKRTEQQIEADFAAHKGDFDYLLGDWEFTAQSKEYDRFRGYWSAVKLDEGQILDEYRVVGDKAETYYVTTTLRNYNKFADRWELIGADAGGGLQDVGTGRRVGGEVHIEQRFGVASGTPSTWRIRYYDIKPDSFSWNADRSTDGGKTWVKNFQTIEARRIGPPRSLGALAPARKGS